MKEKEKTFQRIMHENLMREIRVLQQGIGLLFKKIERLEQNEPRNPKEDIRSD